MSEPSVSRDKPRRFPLGNLEANDPRNRQDEPGSKLRDERYFILRLINAGISNSVSEMESSMTSLVSLGWVMLGV
jgi:hypothetical protein